MSVKPRNMEFVCLCHQRAIAASDKDREPSPCQLARNRHARMCYRRKASEYQIPLSRSRYGTMVLEYRVVPDGLCQG